MKRLRDMKIGTRLNLVLSIAFIVVVIGLGLYTLNIQTNRIQENTDIRMYEQVADLAQFIEAEIEDNQQNTNHALKTAGYIFEQAGNLNITDSSYVQMRVINQETNRTRSEDLPLWQINGQQIQQSNDLVDKISEVTGADVSIFQKIDGGFCRISTTVTGDNDERQEGTFISSGSEVYQTVQGGQVYRGRAMVVDEWYLTAQEPIRKDGEVVGMIGVGVPEKDLAGLREIFYDKTYFDEGYPYMVNEDGDAIIHPHSETEGTNVSNEDFIQRMFADESGQGMLHYQWEGRSKFQYYQYVEPINSYVAATIYEDDFMGVINQTRTAILMAVLIGIVLFVIINRQVSRSITNGLHKGVDFAKRVANGDLTATVDIEQKDEVGELAEAMNTMVFKLREVVDNVRQGANYIASASQQVSSSSQQLSQGSSEQASSVEEVSSSMEQMVSNIQQNTDNSNQTENIATQAANEMEKMGESSKNSLNSIREIADKITIINDIAFQTNILALNAAVEAARAGENGKGFSVVASEVRKLAERSKEAADEIVELANSSVKVSEEAGEILGNLLPEIEKTAKLVQEISASSKEQNNGADQVNNAVQQLNQVTQQNAASSEELATSAEELAGQADQLNQSISYFKTGQESDTYSVSSNAGSQKQAAGKHSNQGSGTEAKRSQMAGKNRTGASGNGNDKWKDGAGYGTGNGKGNGPDYGTNFNQTGKHGYNLNPGGNGNEKDGDDKDFEQY
ncbi:MAG: Cache 3/Cache 2 fusion domain-containing protein [Bacteroidota bacterium]